MALARGALWLKFGQYMASRADVLPTPYILALDACLDAAAPLNASSVRALVEAEVDASAFDGLDYNDAIACASIAQVHRCRLNGEEVVLKVQRPGVKEVLLQDLADLDAILRLVAGSEPDFDFRPMLTAWMEMVPLECDFKHEARNCDFVRSVLDEARGTEFESKAFVPEVLKEHSTERVMCVRYINGCSIRDLGTLDAAGADRDELVAEISRAFALQIHLLGKWSGDPHSGNIIVELRDGEGKDCLIRPGLIDFGITVELTEMQRLGFCRTVVAAAESDSFSLLQSFADMDIVLNRADPTASLDTIRHLFRSTASRDDSQQQDKEFFKRAKARDEANFDTGIAVDKRAAGDGLVSEGKKSGGVRQRVSNYLRGQKTDEMALKAPPRTKADGGRRSPVDAYPGFLVFLFRTLGLLRGLSTRLGVSHTYLPIMYEVAASALRDSVPEDERPRGLVYEAIGAEADEVRAVKSLRSKRAKLLRKVVVRVAEELDKRKLFIGCQLAVYHKGEIVLDFAAGRMGKHNYRPVKPSSLFCPFSTTKGVSAILAAELADEYGIEPTDLVSKWWPAYGCKGKETTTVAMLLGHRAGLAQCSPDDMSMIRLRDDWQGIVDWLATEATPSHRPGEKVEYHALNFGWLVAGLLHNVAKGSTIQDRLNALATKLGIEDECFIGLSKEMSADVADSRVTVLSNEIYADIGRLMKLQDRAKGGKGNVVDAVSVKDLAAGGESAARQGENIDALYEDGDVGAMKDAKLFFEKILSGQQSKPGASGDAAISDAATPSSGDEEESSDEKPSGLSKLLEKTPYLAEPTFFSHPVLREAVAPAVNGHFSARALAKMFSALARDGKVDGEQILKKGRTARMMEVVEGEDDPFGAGGVRVYKCMDRRGRPAKSRAVGHQGLGGSVAFAVPDHDFSMAFTCNQLNAVSAAGSVFISAVCAVLNIPVPEAYAGLLHKLREAHSSEDGDVEAALAEMDGDIEKAISSFTVLRALTG